MYYDPERTSCVLCVQSTKSQLVGVSVSTSPLRSGSASASQFTRTHVHNQNSEKILYDAEITEPSPIPQSAHISRLCTQCTRKSQS